MFDACSVGVEFKVITVKSLAVLTLALLPAVCLAQQPTGTIAGAVRDPTGGVVRGVQVEALSQATRQIRRTNTDDHGEYSVPALLAGEYEMRVTAVGFQRIVRVAIVEAGSTTRADFCCGWRTSVRLSRLSPSRR